MYREMLHTTFENIQAVRAKGSTRIPAVFTVDEGETGPVPITGCLSYHRLFALRKRDALGGVPAPSCERYRF